MPESVCGPTRGAGADADIRRLHGTSYAIHGTIAGARKAAAGSQVETPAEAT